MRLTLRLDRVILLDVALFEPADDEVSVYESCAQTEIPFGFTPSEEYGDDE